MLTVKMRYEVLLIHFYFRLLTRYLHECDYIADIETNGNAKS